ncbi:MAG: hypothetical protein VB064_06660 [Oscillospiraceae bacterium]|nr:hypothetical protein [Oscillospiraceae bacterium]
MDKLPPDHKARWFAEAALCLVDRLHNPIRSTFQMKQLGLLAVCADEKESVFDSVITMYRSVLSCFFLADGGMVTVYGV